VNHIHRLSAALALVSFALAAVVCADSNAASGAAVSQTPPVNANAKIMADFTARVTEYTKLRDKHVAAIPKLKQESTPKQMDEHQRALAALIAQERATAKRGDMFDPEIEKVVRSLMAQVFKNPKDRAELRASIAEENPKGVVLKVNGRYPDTVPLTSMPPDVLKNLPPLPEEIEYRFVGESLILLDVISHLVVDFMSFALPKA
jgi:hypothetical protein